MLRSLGFVVALVLAPGFIVPTQADERTSDRTLPMRFELRRQGPAELCGTQCKTWIAASGAITADSGRDFTQFMRSRAPAGRAQRGGTVVLDSDGGSVLGAIALGREIRKAELSTTVGRLIDIDAGAARDDAPRATFSPRADCESMCAFVLLGGIERVVPKEARVMVHQIWLGDRREDPTAATYSAEDLVLVQRDIGRLAQFTAEMGASIDLLDLALRIPPWEPLHVMTADEIRRTKLATGDAPDAMPTTMAASPPVTAPVLKPATNGTRATPINELRWAMVDRAGVASLARRHPLTVEGDDIGSFDMVVACGAGPDSFDLSYVERRHGSESTVVPSKLSAVRLRVGRNEVALKIVSSERRKNPDELVSYAAGQVPAALVRAFTGTGNHSMVIETESEDKDQPMVTIIRIGNTGARQNLPRLASSCAKPMGDRAEVTLPKVEDKAAVVKTGGMAAAR